MKKFFSQYVGLRPENYILLLGKIVTSLGGMVWPVLTLILTQKLGMSATSASLTMIVAGLVQMPLVYIGGKLADKRNKKNIIVVCDTISVAFYIVCAIIPLSITTIVLLIMAASLQCMEYPAYDALVADLNVTKDRERAYSLLYLGSNLGMVASPTIAGLLFKHLLWLSFLISGIAIFMSTTLIFFFIKDIRPVEEKSEAGVYQEAKENVSLLNVLRGNKVIVLYILTMAFYWALYGQWGYLMPLDLARVHGDDGALIYGTVNSLNCIVVVVMTPVLTSLLSKICLTKKSFIGTLLVASGYIIFLLGLGYIPVYYIAIVLFTLGEILSTITSGPYMTERIPASHRGRLNSVNNLCQNIISGITMYGVGALYDNFGSTASWIFVFALVTVCMVGGMVLIPLDRRTYKKLYK